MRALSSPWSAGCIGRTRPAGGSAGIPHASERFRLGRLPLDSARPMSESFQNSDLRGLKVLLADQDEGALRITAALVRELGHEVSEMAIGLHEAAECIARDDPDLSIVVVYED